MEEMIYGSREESQKILLKGEYQGYIFCIFSLGSHPCAYVAIPEEHQYYMKNIEEYNIECHGGLTYFGDLYHIYNLEMHKKEKNWCFNYWVGWDYAHAGDYIYESEKKLNIDGISKKWTTEEIYEEVKRVIEQLQLKEMKPNEFSNKDSVKGC